MLFWSIYIFKKNGILKKKSDQSFVWIIQLDYQIKRIQIFIYVLLIFRCKT